MLSCDNNYIYIQRTLQLHTVKPFFQQSIHTDHHSSLALNQAEEYTVTPGGFEQADS